MVNDGLTEINMKLCNYMNDGAGYQAKCVLAIMQVEEALVPESWNDDFHKYDAEPQVGRWENCREQGYCIYMRNRNFDQINIAFFEHRNTDQICVLVWHQNTINTPNIDSMDTKGECYKDKWDITKSFPYDSFREAAEYIQEVAMREARKETISKLVDTDNILKPKQ